MLEAARGFIRDTLGAVRNVQQLLRSIKVGPKALVSVIPDLHASCGPLAEAFRQLLGAIEAEQPDAARALLSFVSPRIAELESALGEAASGPLNARQRLKLEQVITRAAVDLDTARSHLELVEQALGGGRARVELAELVKQTFKAPEEVSTRPAATTQATISAAVSLEIQVNPRVAMNLIALGVRLVAGKEPGSTPHVSIRRQPEGGWALSISKQPGAGERLQLLAPRLIEPSLACAKAVAQAMGGRLEQTAQGSLELFWPPDIE